MRSLQLLIYGCVQLLVMLTVAPGVAAEERPVPKGVIFVLIDDIGYGDIDVLHPSSLETPNIDTLYRQSVRLTDFHVGTTCSPSRASLLTGRSVNSGGVWHTIAGREILRQNEQTLAEVFQANGWNTGIFGKWHLGEGYPFSPRFRGFGTAVIHGGGGVGQGSDYWKNDYYSGVDFQGNPNSPDVYLANGKPFKADQFCTDLWFDQAKQFIKRSVDQGKPFFCYLPTNAAHGPFNAPYGFKKGFDGLIENVDHNMGQLDQFLSAQGIKDDVLLIFCSDNGTAGDRLGGLRQQKGSHYDGGHNVPCFWRWKAAGLAGSPDAAADISGLTSSMDLFPTLLDLFDLERPSGGQPLHGISLKPMLLDPNYVPVQRTVVVDTQRDADFQKWKLACVMRDEVINGKIVHKWRLIRRAEQAESELYDFLVDRGTGNNLLEDEAQEGSQSLVASLSDSYEAWWKDVSPGWQIFPPFVLNDQMESELALFAHSWIGETSSPWHQGLVSRAAAGTGTHAIRFDQSGRYQFELRRWPREDGGLIAGTNSTGGGTALPVVKAKITLAGVGEIDKSVAKEDAAVTFEWNVQAGEATTLTTAFLGENGSVLSGAYYVYIRKLGDVESKN